MPPLVKSTGTILRSGSVWGRRSKLIAYVADGMLQKIKSEICPREEHIVTAFLQNSGFIDILMPFRSILYGAWAAQKNT